jgi:Na+-driven multidrug efflux pump
LIAGLIFTAGLIVGGFLLPLIYPRVGRDVLQVAFWGAIIVALVQPAKVLNSYLGSGLLPSGGDTKFVLLTHVISSYLIGLPVAGIFGLALKIGAWTVFASRGLEETVKAVMLILRARTGNWQRRL